MPTPIEQNTIDLQAILEMILNLPDAGSAFSASHDSKGNVTFAGMSIVSQADGHVVLE